MASEGDTESTLNTAPSSYLNYLPGIYSGPDGSGSVPFLALYLKVFEKLLSGIGDGEDLALADPNLDLSVANRAGIRQLLNASVIGNLFYPRWSFLFPSGDQNSDPSVFMPPLSGDGDSDDQTALFNTLANYFGLPEFTGEVDGLSPVEIWARSFLSWLGGTIGLEIDKNWSIDSVRTLIGQAFPFARARGTPMGMTWLLNSYLLARPVAIDGVTLTEATVDECFRPTIIVYDEDPGTPSAFRVCDSYAADPAQAVIISDVVGSTIDRDLTGTPTAVDDTTVVAYVPWRFEVDITLLATASVLASDQARAVQAYFRLARSALDSARPALTTYAVNFTVNVQTPSSSSSSSPSYWARDRSEVWADFEDAK